MTQPNLHPRLDLNRWKSVFPLNLLREMATEYAVRPDSRRMARTVSEHDVRRHVAMLEPCGERICSPSSIAVVEQLREEVLVGRPLNPRIPTDVFVFAEGEPDDPRITKVGGRPYWPRQLPWPTDTNGRPAAFVGQVYFGDSCDITGELPGDLLVVTAIDIDLETESFSYHWFTTSRDAIELADEPANPVFAVFPCFGHIHRTWDYPNGDDAFERVRQYEYLAVIEGTKIGGCPRWIQEDETPPGARFICSVGSTEPGYSCDWHPSSYPFINRRDPLDAWGTDRLLPEPLTIGDAGSLYVFLQPNGCTIGVVQCY